MKRTILTLAAASTILFATACNTESANNGSDMAHQEMAHEEMHGEEMTEGEMDHQMMTNTADEAEADVPVYEQVPAGVKTQVQQLTNYYLEIKNALVASKPVEAQTAATKIMAPLEQFNATTLPAEQQELYKQQASNIQNAASAIIKANDINAQRDQLGTLTQSVYALNKAFGANETALYRQYCPMANNNKGGYWLSSEKEIRNPYFGDKMLKCGKVAETL